MYPIIDPERTGKQIKVYMLEKGISVRQIQEYLGLTSVQTVYHWLEGISMPNIDNLYALSQLFQVEVDELICGTKKRLSTEERKRLERLKRYNYKLGEIIIEREFY